MKKTLLLFITAITTLSLSAAPVEVLSNKKLAKGYFPQFNATATELMFLGTETERHAVSQEDEMYVTNEDLKLVLYRNGVRTELYPHGEDINYICASISPDGNKILFKTSKGIGICDLNGNALANLGRYTAPVWYGNDYVVATLEENDGHNFTAGAVVILSLDGQLNQVLTDKAEIAMCPTVNYETGQIAYHDFDGNIHLMQINLADKAIKKRALPVLRKVEGVKAKPIRRLQSATPEEFAKYRIYINPGHGGYDGDDRGMSGWFNETTKGYIFWESQSNLDKGLQLQKWLDDLNFTTEISRTQNRTEDDKDLYDIVCEANDFNADFMLSIHTNAGGPSNYVLQLYSGWTDGDTHTYSHKVTTENNRIGRDLTTMLGNNQYANAISTWTAKPRIEGDKTFARTAMGWSNGYGVLRWLNVPGTISEGAMHDYYPETYRLMNMDYKHQEAWNFMKTFCNYFLNHELPQGVIAGQVRDAFQKQIFPPIKRIKGSRDEQLPLNKAKVELLKAGTVINTYITDTCYNGVFFFWNLEPGTYTLRSAVDHYYNKEVELEVKANEITYHDFMLNMMRETPPVVTSYSPNVAIDDSVQVSTPIVIDFNWDMWEEHTLKAFSISPEVEGTLEMENSQRTLRFTPKVSFEKATEYTVTLTTEACHPDTLFPNHLEQDLVFKFRTKNRGKVSVLQSYPEDGATNVSRTPTVFLLTDAELETGTVSNTKLVLTDTENAKTTPGARAIDKNSVAQPYGSITFNITKELKPNMKYTLTVDPSIADVYGVTLLYPYTISFTTGSGEETYVGEILNELDTAFFYVDAEKTAGMKDKSIMTSGSKYTSGKASNSIEYEFNGLEDDEAIFFKAYDMSYVFHHGDTIALDIYGDISYNNLYAEFVAEGEQKLVPICELNYSGYQHHAICLDALFEGIEYNFSGLRLERSSNILSTKGTIYIDALRRVCIVPPSQTAVENVAGDQDAKTRKVLDDNQVIIIQDKKHYNVQGTQVK